MGHRVSVIALTLLVLLVAVCASKEAHTMATLQITSPAFQNDGQIPRLYTCDGKDINPALVIAGVPQGTRSLALICDDPDAPVGIWVHWVVWNIDAGVKEIKENTVPSGAVQGINDFRKHAYGGPCPPSGTHRYFFKVYALDQMLQISPNSTKADLERAMKGHVLAEGQLVGLYQR
jgi:Raf kinase inhibitor-like YbhB/YbcL family protein